MVNRPPSSSGHETLPHARIPHQRAARRRPLPCGRKPVADRDRRGTRKGPDSSGLWIAPPWLSAGNALIINDIDL